MDEKILALFERLVVAIETVAKAVKDEQVAQEQRWYPEDYNQEEDEDS